MNNISSGATFSRVRPYLLATAAVAGIVVGSAAQAQSTGPILDITSMENLRHSNAVSVANPLQVENVRHAAVSATGIVGVVNEPAIIISQPGTPTTARDPVNINGVGQMWVESGAPGAGQLGLCTGSLINPRTVLFAAHCVNTRAATAYGSGSGGVPIAFGFNTANNTTVPGQPVGTSPLLNWIRGILQYRTDPGNFVYNVNAVAYHPLSLEPAAIGFLFADVAIASLDTPAANVPTWALLLSRLPVPTNPTAASGTGYHVNITGYGRNGVGDVGPTGGIDFRRRIAENWLGALTSLDVRDTAIFGGVPAISRPQNLYWTDFDDPRRGTAAASPFDFNLFRDNALPNEGTTAGGDSGGPLILDRTFARQVVIGVLSGGSRFFGPQPFSSYGTASFYQPLYLYWDWIAANNPYRYVSSLAGDGNWTDPTRWITNNDPNYFIIGANNTLVNGVPGLVGEQNLGASGQFGQLCTQGGVAGAIGANTCLDLSTGLTFPTPGGIGTAGDVTLNSGIGSALVNGISNGLGSAIVDGASDSNSGATVQIGAADQPMSGGVVTSQNVPPPTIANGLPGALNFVPNNLGGTRATGVLPRYFDVTLAATGTITLDTAVTIDRFRLNGVGAALNIATTGVLNSLIDVTQSVGTMQVNGRLNSVGDYFLQVGGLNGIGTINAPFFTSALGVISPGMSGNVGSFGTLNFIGNVVLATGNTYRVDLGANGTSDVIAVARSATSTTNGIANLGGNLQFAFSNDTLRAGNVYTIVTAQGGVTGAFQTPTAISAILTPTIVTSANAVQVSIVPGLYRNVVNSTARVQVSYAQLLDQNRSNSAALAGLYGTLDLQSAATIRSTLDSWAPQSETLNYALATAAVDNMARFYRQRLQLIGGVRQGGTLAIIGRPIELAAINTNGIGNGAGGVQPVASDTGAAMVQEGRLPEDTSAYLAGGYIDGSSRSMPLAMPFGGRDRFNGFYIAGGIEKQLDSDSIVGFSLSFTDVRGNTNAAPQTASGQLILGTIYSRFEAGSGISIDGQISAGLYNSTTVRNVSLVGTPFALTARDNSLVIGSEVGVQKSFTSGKFEIDPRIGLRTNLVGFSRTAETGGGPALAIDRSSRLSAQGRVGFNAAYNGAIRPYVSAYFVREFANLPTTVGGNFVGGIGGNAAFLLGTATRNWGEVSGGISYVTGEVEFSLSADTTISRSDVENRSYRGGFRVRF